MGTPELANMFIVFPHVRIPISLWVRGMRRLMSSGAGLATACVSVVTTSRLSSLNITPALYLCTAHITLPGSP